MIAVNYSALRQSLKEYCDRISDEAEVLVVTRKGGNNVVMISEQKYNNMLENAYLRANPANYEHILKSLEQLRCGHGHAHELVDTQEPEDE